MSSSKMQKCRYNIYDETDTISLETSDVYFLSVKQKGKQLRMGICNPYSFKFELLFFAQIRFLK